MKGTEPTSSNESDSIQKLVSYSFIGVVFLIVLFFILSVVREKERGIEVERPLTGVCDGWAQNVVVISINQNGNFLLDGKIVDSAGIVTSIKLRLQELDKDERLAILIQPHDQSQMNDFARIYDLVNGIDDPRKTVVFR